jgi:DNA helicase IV
MNLKVIPGLDIIKKNNVMVGMKGYWVGRYENLANLLFDPAIQLPGAQNIVFFGIIPKKRLLCSAVSTLNCIEKPTGKNCVEEIIDTYEEYKTLWDLHREQVQVQIELNDLKVKTNTISKEELFIQIYPKLLSYELANVQDAIASRKKLDKEGLIREIRLALWRSDFSLVEYMYRNNIDLISQEFFNDLLKTANQRQALELRNISVNEIINKITILLQKFDFCGANELFEEIKNDYAVEDFEKLVQESKAKQAKVFLANAIHNEFREGHYQNAEQLFQQSKLISTEDYLQIAGPYIQEYVKNRYGESISEEQATALIHPSQNLLISARAGSGKTRVLACKTSLLIDLARVHPDRLLVMAFNNPAASEILGRIRTNFKQPAFENARTFHSLAMQLVQPEENLLYDDQKDYANQAMSQFIQTLLKEEIHNPIFIEKMYAFFRNEMREIERAGFLLDDRSYFDFRRSMQQVTLKGEKVKSTGEKFIADYLFEHDIVYRYEKTWKWGSQIYRPDFSLLHEQKDFVIEHWGIDEYDPQRKVPEEWTQTWDQYHSQMQAKRAHWKEEGVTLIETSIRDLRGGREAFEQILGDRLALTGIQNTKLFTAELFNRVKEHDANITKMANLFVQFIQKAKKQMLKAKDVQNLLRTYQPDDEREAVFIDLACRVYLEYEPALVRHKKIDFDDLLIRAIEKIHATQGNCTIRLGKKSRLVKMNELRWILLDEYQDFSRLFYELIAAIRRYNPDVRLYCVGDDWQSINGYAGSDLAYFTRFINWVENASKVYLTTNFRSRAAIVTNGNALMANKGIPAEAAPDHPGGEVCVEKMDDTWVEMRENTDQKKDDERFLITEDSIIGNGNKSYRVIASKYLKRCYQIISSKRQNIESVAILNRTNWIDGIRLSDFRKKLLSCFTTTDLKDNWGPEKRIQIITAHKSKGLQADLVIILNACDRSFPLIHPDSALFRIFGKTPADAYEEELRLFYVAATRAKNSLYILTEKGRESAFLDRLPAYQTNKKAETSTVTLKQSTEPPFSINADKIPF